MPITTVETSKKGSINWRDVWQGLVVAVGTPVFTIIYNSINAGSWTFDWKNIASTAIIAAMGYVVKKFFTPAQTITTVKPL